MEGALEGDNDNGINCNSSVSSLSHKEKYEILLVMGTGGIAAVVTCTIALVMAFMFKLHRYFVHRLAIYQVLAALFFGIVCILEMIFINYDSNRKLYNPLCKAAGFLLEYAVWVKLLIMSCLTFHLLCFAVCYANLKRLEYVYLLISVLLPLLFSWIPFIHGVYGPAGAWCWIQNWKGDCANEKLPDGEIEEYALLYGPAFICLTLAAIAVLVIMMVLSWRAYCHQLRTRSTDSIPLLAFKEVQKRKKALREILPLVSYPVLFIIFFLPSFVNRIKGAILKEASLSSFMWSAATTPCLSLFAALALIVHIVILKCRKHVFKHFFSRSSSQAGQEIQTPYTVVKTDAFTSETVASTNARSQWDIPHESDIDD